MEPGRTEIINMALLFCNQDGILDGDGTSKNAKLSDMFYDTTLDEALSGHPWSFALVATQLKQLAKTPRDFRFKYAYQLPEDFGRMQQTSSRAVVDLTADNTIAKELIIHETGDRANSIPIPEYIVQGKELYSNYVDLQIVYSRTDVRPHEMTPQFRNYFAALLASKLYLKLTGGVDGFQEIQQKVLLYRNEARNTDSDQMDTLEPNRPNLLIAARIY